MSDDPTLDPTVAITFPGQPLIFAVPVLVILTMVAIVVIQKSRHRTAAAAAWASASNELGIQFVGDGSKLGPVARGQVKSHVVSITPVHKGDKKQIVTQFSVKFAASEAPKFKLVKRMSDSSSTVDTGNPKFDAVVTVQTDEPDLLSRYLTGSHRAAILRLLTYWPSAQITNRDAHLLTSGIERNHDKLVDSICHLVASAETFDRPTHTADVTPAETQEYIANTEPQHSDVVAEQHPEDTTDVGALIDAPVFSAQDDQRVNGESRLVTNLGLDEATVLNELFSSGLDPSGISARFQQVYQGHKVTWTGEVVRVGSAERGVQRVAAFIGSADGVNVDSGRVVALTTIKSEPVVCEGDVVAFSGSLVKLDASQRLFHVA